MIEEQVTGGMKEPHLDFFFFVNTLLIKKKKKIKQCKNMILVYEGKHIPAAICSIIVILLADLDC